MDKFYYHHLLAWRAYLLNDIPLATSNQAQATALSERMGLWFTVGLSHFAGSILARANNDLRQAKEHAAACGELGRKYNSKFFEFRAYLLQTVLALDEDNKKSAANYLSKALALAKTEGYVYFVWWPPTLMTELCMHAFEIGLEIEFVQGLVRTCNLLSDEPPLHIEHWPWAVKIRTLGKFELLLDDTAVRFTGKVQKKPLEMLKALISLGGHDVREDRLSDLLWPDAEGDSAHSAFSTNLQRLRTLLGNDDALQLREGRLSLDSRLCWVDAWAFERAVEEAEAAWITSEQAASDSEQSQHKRNVALRLTEKSAALYKGHFLSDDSEQAWTVSYRERLRSKFFRCIGQLGDYHEQAGQVNLAVECYQRSLDIDELVEDTYQRLMLCYKKLGRTTEALAVYKRCCAALSIHMDITPSEKTEKIYAMLRQ
jgi:DNA-binding SARP family transcriptional activator